MKIKVNPKYWNQKRANVDFAGDRFDMIDKMKASIELKLREKAMSGNFYNAKDLLNKEQAQKNPSLVNIIQDYIDFEKRSKKGSTIKAHGHKLSNLKAYQKEMKLDFTAASFDLAESYRFIDWFQMSKGTSNKSSANRNVLFYRTAMLHAIKTGASQNCGLRDFVGERDASNKPVWLTQEEVNKFESLDFQDPFLSNIVLMFLFQCYTGLSFADLWECWTIEQKDNNCLMLYGERAKNGNSFCVPLIDEVIDLMDRHPKGFKPISNACYNRYLKDLAIGLDIDKRLTTHVARKTFATLMDQKGWSRESVSRMLGHRSVKTTEQYYVGDSSKRVENEFMERRRAV